MKVNNNLFVEAKYKLFIDDEEGKGEELVEETTQDVPFQYIHGLGLMLPASHSGSFGKRPVSSPAAITPARSRAQRSSAGVIAIRFKVLCSLNEHNG